MTRRELDAYVLDHYKTMTVRQMSKATGETVSRIYCSCYRQEVKAKSRKHRTDRTVCSNRPESCYNCPYPECVCNGSVTESEGAYLFAGLGNDDNRTAKKVQRIQ